MYVNEALELNSEDVLPVLPCEQLKGRERSSSIDTGSLGSRLDEGVSQCRGLQRRCKGAPARAPRRAAAAAPAAAGIPTTVGCSAAGHGQHRAAGQVFTNRASPKGPAKFSKRNKFFNWFSGSQHWQADGAWRGRCHNRNAQRTGIAPHFISRSGGPLSPSKAASIRSGNKAQNTELRAAKAGTI
jgi:hypothetical protein